MSLKKTFLGVELSSSKKVNFLTFTALILLLVSIVSLPYVYQKRNSIFPPMFIDSSDKHGVVFNIDHSIFLLYKDGSFIEEASYKDLGLKGVADIKFLDYSLLITQEDGKIKLCSIPINSCEEIGSVGSYRADILMRIILSKDRESFYIVQTNKSKISKFDKDGQYLYQLHLKEKDMKYPGGGVALSNDTILVADSKNKRVIAIQDRGEDNTTILWSLSSTSDAGRSSHRKVLDVKFDTSHNIWMINSNNEYDSSETVIMNIPSIKEYMTNDTHISSRKKDIKVENGNTNRINSSMSIYPESMAPHKDGMLVADKESFKILYIDDTSNSTIFGDWYIQSKIKKLHKRVNKYQSIINLFLWLFGLAILIAIIAAILEMPNSARELMAKTKDIISDKDITLSAEKIIKPNEAGVIWLLPNEKLLKQIKWLKALFVLTIPFSTYLLMDLLSSQTITTNGFIEIVTITSMPISILYIIYFLDFSKLAIGVDDTSFYLVSNFNRKAMAPFADVYYSTHSLEDNQPADRIAIGNTTIPLMHNNQKFNNDLFDKEQFDYYIKPKLKYAHKISWNSMFERQIKGINVKMWLILSMPIILMGIVYIML